MRRSRSKSSKALRERFAGGAVRAPLVRLDADVPGDEIYLKLEVLQPVGSFTIRGAGSLHRVAVRRRAGRDRAHAELRRGKIVAIVSGGGIDASELAGILSEAG